MTIVVHSGQHWRDGQVWNHSVAAVGACRRSAGEAAMCAWREAARRVGATPCGGSVSRIVPDSDVRMIAAAVTAPGGLSGADDLPSGYTPREWAAVAELVEARA